MATRNIEALIISLRAMAKHRHDDLSIADEAADMIERMYHWLLSDCECPCCLGIEACKPGCTFAEDAPNEKERMANVRDVLFGQQRQL